MPSVVGVTVTEGSDLGIDLFLECVGVYEEGCDVVGRDKEKARRALGGWEHLMIPVRTVTTNGQEKPRLQRLL